MKKILITGVGSGLGKALAEAYLERGDTVYAIGRKCPEALCSHSRFFFFPYDLSETFALQAAVEKFIAKRTFDLVILNAGVLGEIQTLTESDLLDIKEVMEVNVWANKELIDALDRFAIAKQIVGISSGAAVNGSKGWGAYSLSKAALNMLLNVYAKELPRIHFTALAPGVIRTPMVEHILNDIDEAQYPSVKRLRENLIRTPEEAAEMLIPTFEKLLEYESGSFLDVRTMNH